MKDESAKRVPKLSIDLALQSQIEEAPALIEFGDLRIDTEKMLVLVNKQRVELAVQEYRVLVALAESIGRPVPHSRLAMILWQELRPQYERHLSVLVARLRSKVAGSKSLRLETLRKRGYCLMPAGSGNRIEQIKRAKDGLDVLDDILRYARTGAPIDSDDLERMKWYGVFERRQTPGYFMFRLRIPNGVLTSEQIQTIGLLSNRFGRGELDITTRQNMQLRWIRIHDVPEIFRVLDAVGLDYRQSGMDSVRNVTGCPMAGLDPHEIVDASPIARAVQQAIVGLKEFSNLPRKFNISVSGCIRDCATAQANDLALMPALKDGRPGFNVLAGGMGGRAPTYAAPLDIFLTPDQAPSFCATLLRLYSEEGPRENRQSARLRFMLDDWGIVRFRDELEKRFGPLEHAGDDQTIAFAGDHMGVAQQKQSGLRTVGCLVPVGRINGDDLIEFGRLAHEYGDGEIRLTNKQNMLLVDVPEARVGELMREPLLLRYQPAPSSWSQHTVACTGKDFCHYGQIETKGTAIEFSRADAGADARRVGDARALVGLPARLRSALYRRHRADVRGKGNGRRRAGGRGRRVHRRPAGQGPSTGDQGARRSTARRPSLATRRVPVAARSRRYGEPHRRSVAPGFVRRAATIRSTAAAVTTPARQRVSQPENPCVGRSHVRHRFVCVQSLGLPGGGLVRAQGPRFKAELYQPGPH